MAGGAVAVQGTNEGIRALIHPGAWYKNSRIVKLNLWIILLLITSSTNGYDGSMMSKQRLSSLETLYSRGCFF